MATPKERNDERERAHNARVGRGSAPERKSDPSDLAEQQGDGQPENARELEDRSSGSGQAGATPDE